MSNEFSLLPSLSAFFFGSFFGTLLGPLLLEEIRHGIKRCRWNRPRSKLLQTRLESAKGEGWVSLEVLTILTGTSDDECRALLIELNARGGRVRGGKEAWALISRRPLSVSGKNAVVDPEEEE